MTVDEALVMARAALEDEIADDAAEVWGDESRVVIWFTPDPPGSLGWGGVGVDLNTGAITWHGSGKPPQDLNEGLREL